MSASARWTELESVVRDASDAIGGAAASVVVLDRDGVVFEHTSGRLDVRGAVLADAGSVFGAASITKVVTALAIMRCVEARQIALEDRVTRCLPAFNPGDARMSAITIEMLLSHTSGLSGFDPYTWHLEPDDGPTAIESAARAAAKSRLVSDPGARFHYSESAYDTLGALLEHVGGAPYEEIVHREVLAPLAMHRSTMRPMSGERRAWPHVLDEQGALRAGDVVPTNRAHSPSGGMQTTPRDLAALCRALLGPSGDWLSAASLRTMSTERAATGRASTPGMGLGLFLRDYGGDRVVGHGGLDIGYRCGISVIPARGVGVVVMMNAMWGPVMDLCNAGLDAALGRAPERAVAPRADYGSFVGRFAEDGAVVTVAEDEAGLWLQYEDRRSRLTPLSAQSFVCLADDDALNRSVIVVSRDRVELGGRTLRRS